MKVYIHMWLSYHFTTELFSYRYLVGNSQENYFNCYQHFWHAFEMWHVALRRCSNKSCHDDTWFMTNKHNSWHILMYPHLVQWNEVHTLDNMLQETFEVVWNFIFILMLCFLYLDLNFPMSNVHIVIYNFRG